MSSEITPTSAKNTAGALQTDKSPDRLLTGLRINLIPDEITARLEQERPPTRALWHPVRSGPSALLSLWSEVERLRVLRLTVSSSTAGWHPGWARWTYAVRRPPTPDAIALADTPGQGIDTQAILAHTTQEDLLSPDASVLTLLFLPGEQRDVSLDFYVTLNAETKAGDYEFTVVVEEIEEIENTAATAAPSVLKVDGILHLRHPGTTLLKYLPEIYTPVPETPLSRGKWFVQYEDPPFFERFLRGFQDAEEPLQARMAHIEQLFDAMQAPVDLLPWLATWVALVLNENWPELKRRRLIREAVELYRWRGTCRGLTRYLEIYVGIKPQISDAPLIGMRLGASAVLGSDSRSGEVSPPITQLGDVPLYTTRLGDVPPHTFVVTLTVDEPADINEAMVRAIIEAEKPAHTAYQLRIVKNATPQISVGPDKRK